jgi:hypothetical protein
MFYVFLPDFNHRRKFDQAFWSWYKNPTPQNAILLADQQRRNMFYRWGVSAIGAFSISIWARLLQNCPASAVS